MSGIPVPKFCILFCVLQVTNAAFWGLIRLYLDVCVEMRTVEFIVLCLKFHNPTYKSKELQ